MKNKLIVTVSLISVLLVGLFIFIQRPWQSFHRIAPDRETINSVIEKYGEAAEKRLIPYFEKAGIDYPPESLILLALKDEKRLELWTRKENFRSLIKSYDIQAASGVAGPKLREGDHQVPEGFYRILSLNPNSSYHLSMELNYPNEFDLEHAAHEGRTQPGFDIYIHGKAESVGCLAMGDEAIEELFTLAYRTGINSIEVIIAPSDPRKTVLVKPDHLQQDWINVLYRELSAEIQKYQ